MLDDDYHSYLLRMWRVRTDGHSWRAMLENVATGERQGFASLDRLIMFLEMISGQEEMPESTQGCGKEASDEIEPNYRII